VSARGPGWWLAMVATVAMLAVAATGLWILGTPAHQRAQRLDARRVQDLRMLSSNISIYWTLHKELPPDLEHLDASPARLRDPQSGIAYEYTIIGNTQYRLCARFQEPWPNAAGHREPMPAQPVPGNDSWRHAAGKVCFERSVKH